MGRKISPKIQHATEEFLATLGSSPQQLTEKQWEVVVNHIKYQRTIKVVLPMILLFAVFYTWLTIWAFQRTNNLIDRAVPDEVIYVSKAGTETSIPFEPDQIKTYLESLKKSSFHSAAGVFFAPFFFTIFVCYFLFRKHKVKVIQAVVERK